MDNIDYNLSVKKYHLDRVRDALKDEPVALEKICEFVNRTDNFEYSVFCRELYKFALQISPKNRTLKYYRGIQ